MKKMLFILSILALSFNTYSHCGSCGVGGSEEEHQEGEDTTHHERDAKYEEAGKKKEAIMNDEMDSDENSDYDE